MRGWNVVVTGASRGIGLAVARTLAGAGANVAMWGTKEETARPAAEAVAAEFGVKTLWRALDVGDSAAVDAAADAALEAFGSVEGLVNNAGITKDGLLLRMKDEDWNAVTRTNLDGAFYVTRAFARSMVKARRGSVVNVTSVVGVMGNAGQANYSAAKAGMIGFTKSCAREFASRGIRVNAVAPGYIGTDMTAAMPEAAKEKVLGQIPLGSIGAVEDVAETVAFLLSDRARYVTGQVWHVDGGMAM